ncbi:hypothetical protein H4P12_16410 [Paracoccus sp. 11-3]|uniref:Uncharacterized protein n=1 Tax=Paracoccus amoyensis TaxID=2760093 RepID=A0A926J7E7_9RHOB|nr:hypothetical protein [Paracoccus amoyensis]MBC9248257.1 hypothetical protein [Paracoccus amoyensis]
MPSDKDTYRLTEADRTSETRFGPRPVPPGHRTGAGYPYQDRAASHGRSDHPAASLTSKIVVWGGIALGVAGATAATVMAARKVGDMMRDDVSEKPARPRPYTPQQEHVAPRFAAMDDDEQEAMRRRVRARARADEEDAARLRVAASRRRRKPKRNFAQDLTETASSLSSGLDGVTKSLASAFQGFRSVATQATGIVSEFVLAAEQLRSVLRGSEQAGQPARRDDHQRADADDAVTRERQRTHRL